MAPVFVSRKKAGMANGANRLKELRKSAGLTQQEVADASGFSVPQISRWETGADSIPSSRLPALAAAYRCSIGEIFEAAAAPRPIGATVRLDVVLPDEAALASMFETLLRAMPQGSSRTQALYLAATLPSALQLLAGAGEAPPASPPAPPSRPHANGPDGPATTRD